MGDTSISWTDKTWNPIRGCSRVSEGCRHCYAEAIAARFSKPGQPYEGLAKIDVRTGHHPKWTGEVRMVLEHLFDPFRWKKPRRVFVNSMSDLFHEKLTNEQIAAVFGVMAASPRHTFQVLTKRAKRMREWFEWIDDIASRNREDQAGAVLRAMNTWFAVSGAMIKERDFDLDISREIASAEWPLASVWLGVSVENQEAADERIPHLIKTPAALRFLSCEPLLGDIDLDPPHCQHCYERDREELSVGGDGATPWCINCDSEACYGWWLGDERVSWVICGCESGRGARACNVEWLRSLRNQCADAGVPFFLKQAQATDEEDSSGEPFIHGEHADLKDGPMTPQHKGGGVIELPFLDGAQHAAFPEVER